MLATQGILALALVVVGFALWWFLRNRSITSAQSTGVCVVAMWVTASAIVWWRGTDSATPAEFRGRSQLAQSLDSLAWPETSRTSALPVSTSAAGSQAASVESLVGGLEARLADQPNDANGWALLAQSYAYTSNEEGAEKAVQRAVALGFDERALRDRIASAKRSAPVGDWFDRLVPSKRP